MKTKCFHVYTGRQGSHRTGPCAENPGSNFQWKYRLPFSRSRSPHTFHHQETPLVTSHNGLHHCKGSIYQAALQHELICVCLGIVAKDPQISVHVHHEMCFQCQNGTRSWSHKRLAIRNNFGRCQPSWYGYPKVRHPAHRTPWALQKQL